jgi:hypothetical protein
MIPLLFSCYVKSAETISHNDLHNPEIVYNQQLVGTQAEILANNVAPNRAILDRTILAKITSHHICFLLS